MPIPFALPLALSVGKGLFGLFSNKSKVERPTITENPYLLQALDIAKREAATKGLTGADTLQKKLDQDVAGYINQGKASTNGADFLTGLATAQAGKMNQEADMAYKGALEDKQDEATLINQLGVNAQDANRVVDWNTIGKYQDDVAREKARKESIGNGIGDISSAFSTLLKGNSQLAGAGGDASSILTKLLGL